MPNPVQFDIPPRKERIPPYRLNRLDGGLNLRLIESEIQDTQSPYLVNVNADDRGAIQKRPGQAKVYSTSLGTGGINGYFDYRKLDGTTVTLLAHGTKLYTQSGTSQPVEILSGLANAKAAFFVFNDICYMMNGTNFIQYDGTTAQAVDPYIPTISLARTPAGVGTVNESLNFLTNSWKDSFNGDGATAEFTLSYDDLNSTEVKAWVGGVLKSEDTGSGGDFTVNRTNGVVTFGSAPAEGTSNVVIQAAKDGLVDPTNITKCRYVAIFGGRNDTYIFATGHPDYPSQVYRSGLFKPNYWPVNAFALIGSDADANTGFMVYYDQLILFKKRSIYRIEYQISDDGTVVSFPSYPLNSSVGCDMPHSIQLIENNVVFCNTYAGVHILTRTDVRSERNVLPLSGNINGAPYRDGLLDEEENDLVEATSVDYDRKYHLCVGSKVWLWDYSLSPYQGDEDNLKWFYYENVNASCWLVRDRELYFGDRDAGIINKFIVNYNDNGTAINAVWRSRLFYFNLSEWLKNVRMIYFRTRATNMSQLAIRFLNDNGETVDSVEVSSSSFSWTNFSWDAFSWAVYKFIPPFRLKPKIKKVVYFQIEFSNNRVNENLSILDLEIYYDLIKKYK